MTSTTSHTSTRSHPPTQSHRKYPTTNPFTSHPPPALPPRPTSSRRHRRRISPIPAPDAIDLLDTAFGTPYHHDGPFEATLLARQIPGRAPVDALKWSNEQVLLATPEASWRDCLEGHYPLCGVAMYPPGKGGLGTYEECDLRDQEEGEWGVGAYHPSVHQKPNRKPKSEPWYSIAEREKAQKKQALKTQKKAPKTSTSHKQQTHEQGKSKGKNYHYEEMEYEPEPEPVGLGRSSATGGGLSGLAGLTGLGRIRRRINESIRRRV
ncbi:hypothetical protein BZA77DRAFT_315806 [Pyronema omphalodes]|nr:hypothetical protein BZA77DRAFT_315806 [Pyronema omphalodes]